MHPRVHPWPSACIELLLTCSGLTGPENNEEGPSYDCPKDKSPGQPFPQQNTPRSAIPSDGRGEECGGSAACGVETLDGLLAHPEQHGPAIQLQCAYVHSELADVQRVADRFAGYQVIALQTFRVRD